MADRSISYTFKANFAQFRAQVAAAGSAVSDFGAKLEEEAETADGLREQLEFVADSAAKIGLAAGAGFTAAVVTASNFEQALSQVQAATGETATNMVSLKEAALDAGAQTVFSATEAAAAVEELAKAGVSTADILEGGLAGALDLAAAGGLEVAAAAEAAASAMTQFGLAGTDVPHIADLLAAGAGKAQGSVEDMSAALNQSGLVAAQTGLTIEEATGALSAFASAGLTGSDAGTSFKTMLQALTPSSKEAAKLMKDLGISAYDSQGNFVGLTKFADSLRAGLEDLSVEQQNAALKTIFGSDAVRAAAVIYDQGGKGIQEWIDKTNDAGYAAEQAAMRTDNLKGDIEELSGAFETALIGTGEGQLGPIRDLTQSLTDLVNVYNSLPDAAKSVTGSFLGITALLAGGAFFSAKAILSVTAMRAQLAALGTTGALTAQSLKGLTAAGLGIAVLIPVLGQLNQALLETQNLGTGSLDRDLESALLGNSDKVIADFIKQLNYVKSSGYGPKEFGNEVATMYGILGDTAGDKFRENIEGLDAALAGLVESGQGEKAAKLFELLSKGYASTGADIQDVTDVLPGYQQALENSADSGEAVAASTENVALSARQATPEIEELQKALEKASEEAVNGASAFVSFSDSIAGEKFSLGAYLKEFQKQVRALAEFRDNIQKLRDRGLSDTAVDELVKQGPEAAQAVEALANGSDAAIKRLNRTTGRWAEELAGIGSDAAEAEAALLSVADADVTPKADIDLTLFQQKSRRIGDEIQDLIRPRTLTITPTIAGFGFDALRGLFQGSADGSTVPSGGAYRDRYPYLLAPGEEVISNRFGQADRHRPLLKAINAGRLADGGTALAHAQSRQSYSGGYSTSGGGAGIDYDRLAMAMLQARPLYGAVSIQPHNYSEFTRQMDADSRRTALGGIPS